MLSTVKGIFEDGKITLSEKPPVHGRADVIVTFLEEKPQTIKKRQAGVLSGKATMADDFDEPLDDLKEYM